MFVPFGAAPDRKRRQSGDLMRGEGERRGLPTVSTQ